MFTRSKQAYFLRYVRPRWQYILLDIGVGASDSTGAVAQMGSRKICLGEVAGGLWEGGRELHVFNAALLLVGGRQSFSLLSLLLDLDRRRC